MSEKILKLKNNIAGILADSGNESSKEKPLVIFWNAGLLHKVGPFRMFVDLSAKLNQSGFDVFRFDLSGMGDSRSSTTLDLDRDRIISEIQLVMDELSERFGFDRFILMGLCSGADNAFDVALTDDRVHGLVLMDGYTYKTSMYYAYKYMKLFLNVMNPKKMLNYIKKRIINILSSDNEDMTDIAGYVREFPELERFQSSVHDLISRGVNLYFIYSGGYASYAYSNQFYDFSGVEKESKQVDVAYFDQADHMYIIIESRVVLFSSIIDWINKKCS